MCSSLLIRCGWLKSWQYMCLLTEGSYSRNQAMIYSQILWIRVKSQFVPKSLSLVFCSISSSDSKNFSRFLWDWILNNITESKNFVNKVHLKVNDLNGKYEKKIHRQYLKTTSFNFYHGCGKISFPKVRLFLVCYGAI